MDRQYNAWFQPLVKTTCPCGKKHTQCYAWGEYVHAKWQTVEHFCESCFPTRVLNRLDAYSKSSGREVVFQARSGYKLPNFIRG
jgi:hypothetical protein